MNRVNVKCSFVFGELFSKLAHLIKTRRSCNGNCLTCHYYSNCVKDFDS